MLLKMTKMVIMMLKMIRMVIMMLQMIIVNQKMNSSVPMPTTTRLLSPSVPSTKTEAGPWRPLSSNTLWLMLVSTQYMPSSLLSSCFIALQEVHRRHFLCDQHNKPPPRRCVDGGGGDDVDQRSRQRRRRKSWFSRIRQNHDVNFLKTKVKNCNQIIFFTFASTWRQSAAAARGIHTMVSMSRNFHILCNFKIFLWGTGPCGFNLTWKIIFELIGPDNIQTVRN